MEIPPLGNIKDVSLIKLLVYLNRNRKTGTLALKMPVFTKKIYLNTGDAIFASSTYQDDRLGEMLLKADKITVEQYDKAVEILKSSKKRLGAILVELGYLTPKDLFWGVKYQVREIIQSMFLLEDAEYEFKEGQIPTQEVITLKMSIGNLIYEGVKKIDNWTRIRNEMPETDSVLRLSADPLSLFQGIELSSQDKKILSLIDGKKTIKEVIESSWLGSFEALKILYVLWSIGIIEQTTAIGAEAVVSETPGAGEEPMLLDEMLRPHSEEEASLLKKVESVYAKIGGMSKYELLQIDAGTDMETIKKNYYRLAKEFHPDRYFAVTDNSMKAKLTEIFDAITRAYDLLKDEKTGEEYLHTTVNPGQEAAPSKEMKAEDHFKKGVEEFKKGNFSGAVEKFKRAAKLAPKNVQYLSYLSLALSKMPGRLKDAEEALLAAVKLEPFNADHYANLGLLYTKAGIKKRAHSNFEKALKIDPTNEKARQGFEQTKE